MMSWFNEPHITMAALAGEVPRTLAVLLRTVELRMLAVLLRTVEEGLVRAGIVLVKVFVVSTDLQTMIRGL